VILMVSVNRQAPVLARAEIEIEAYPDTVWDIMVNIEDWPRWNPDVKITNLRGELKPSNSFQWKAELGEITSVLQDVEKPHTLTWIAKIMGINAIHTCEIEEKNGKTRIMTEESWEGMISDSMHDKMQEMLEDSLKSCLGYLKIEAESQKH
jgi:uncharacterized protein YndB with AHSA1/START domain